MGCLGHAGRARMVGLALAGLTMVSCIRPDSVTCASGSVCPDGTVCVVAEVADGGAVDVCVTAPQLEACAGEPDRTSCRVESDPGTCFGGACILETCGDGVIAGAEVCDDSNSDPHDGCSADCKSTEVCGDGIIDLAQGEVCDDGSVGLSGDGCTSGCLPEFWQWADYRPASPRPRLSPVLVTDPAGGVLMFGGTVGNGTSLEALAETWRWMGATWERLELAVPSPPGRYRAAVAYDARRGRAVIFGGEGGGGALVPLGDTWEWNGASWIERVSATSPTARSGASFACDDTACVLFGGASGAGDLRDTWRWDGTSWSLLTVTNPPAARNSAAMAYDVGRSRYVLFGGLTGNSVHDDTWEFDGTTWTQVSSGRPPFGSTPMWHASAAWDKKNASVVLVTGVPTSAPNQTRTWRYTGAGWTDAGAVPGPISAHHEVAYNQTRDEVVMLYDSMSIYRLTPTGWATAPSIAGGVASGAAAYDASRRRTIILARDDTTWEWTGDGLAATTAMGPAVAPLVYDSACGTTVAFGGVLAAQNETWSYGTSWTKLAPTGSPAARRGHVLVYDPKRDAIVMFGGVVAGGAYRDDVWELTGGCPKTTWTEVTPTGSRPSARSSSAAAYDPVEGVLLFGGIAGGVAQDDTWRWDGVTWSELQPLTAPSRRGSHAMAFAPRRGRVVLVGGNEGPVRYDDTWEWDADAHTWRGISADGVVPRRRDFGLAADSSGGVVLIGGQDEFTGPSPPAGPLLLRSVQPVEPVEDCQRADVDLDGDDLFGCADPDCYARCAPSCAPGTSCVGPYCGDGVCSVVEDYLICPGDCPTP